MFLLRWGKTKSIPTFKTKIGDLKKNVFIPACTKANGAYKHHHFSHEVSKFRSKIFWLKIFSKKRNPPIFFSKNFLVWKKDLRPQNILGPKKIFVWKNLWSKKILVQKIFWSRKKFLVQKMFCVQKKKCCPEKILNLKFLDQKK